MKTPRQMGTVLGMVTTGLAVSWGALAALAAGGRDYWVYLGTYSGATSKGIYVSRLDANGQLSAPELAAEAVNPAFLAGDARQRFLYAVNEIDDFQGANAGAVSAFAIDASSGGLTLLNQQSTITSGPCHVSVDATSRVVLVATYGGGSVSAYPVNDDGSLGAVSSVVQQRGASVNRDRQNGPHSHWIGMEPGNRFAFVCDLGLDQVLVFQLDPAAATLIPHAPPFARTAPGAGPRHLAFRPDGRFAYVINEMDCTVAVFAWDDARGELTGLQTISTLPAGEALRSGFSTAEIVVHPSGKFLYGSNRGHDSIVVYAIDEASGQLTLAEHVASGGAVPRSFNLDPTGRFLLAANQASGNVVVFHVDERTGCLTPTGARIEIEQPVCVLFVPVRP